MQRLTFSTLIAAAVSCSTAVADEIHVPGDYPTIQEAIDAAQPGDEIIVHEGTYHENLFINDRSFVLRSLSGPASTTIDGQHEDRVAIIGNSGASHVTVDGFTITAGKSEGGGGIQINSGNVLVRNCVFLENVSIDDNGDLDGGGGFRAVLSSGATLEDCYFLRNTSATHGGALEMRSVTVTMIRCKFEDNQAMLMGGAVFGFEGGNPSVADCCFITNSAETGGALASVDGTTTAVSNSSFCGSDPDDIVGNWNDEGGNAFEPECPPDCRVDLNDNCTVDSFDFLLFLNLYVSGDPLADWNEDGKIDTTDFLAFMNEWVLGCP